MHSSNLAIHVLIPITSDNNKGLYLTSHTVIGHLPTNPHQPSPRVTPLFIFLVVILELAETVLAGVTACSGLCSSLQSHQHLWNLLHRHGTVASSLSYSGLPCSRRQARPRSAGWPFRLMPHWPFLIPGPASAFLLSILLLLPK